MESLFGGNWFYRFGFPANHYLIDELGTTFKK